MKQRGVFEKDPGSKVWRVCYYDQFGKKRREKAGTRALHSSFIESANSRY